MWWVMCLWGSDLVWLLVCLMRAICGFKVRYLLIVLI